MKATIEGHELELISIEPYRVPVPSQPIWLHSPELAWKLTEEDGINRYCIDKNGQAWYVFKLGGKFTVADKASLKPPQHIDMFRVDYSLDGELCHALFHERPSHQDALMRIIERLAPNLVRDPVVP